MEPLRGNDLLYKTPALSGERQDQMHTDVPKKSWVRPHIQQCLLGREHYRPQAHRNGRASEKRWLLFLPSPWGRKKDERRNQRTLATPARTHSDEDWRSNASLAPTGDTILRPRTFQPLPPHLFTVSLFHEKRLLGGIQDTQDPRPRNPVASSPPSLSAYPPTADGDGAIAVQNSTPYTRPENTRQPAGQPASRKKNSKLLQAYTETGQRQVRWSPHRGYVRLPVCRLRRLCGLQDFSPPSRR